METHPDWLLGFVDETWWSRFAQPQLHSWREAEQPLRLVEQTARKEDADPKALACYGVLARWMADRLCHATLQLPCQIVPRASVRRCAASLCAGHAQELGGESTPANLMEVNA